jgi:hypothetical protein
MIAHKRPFCAGQATHDAVRPYRTWSITESRWRRRRCLPKAALRTSRRTPDLSRTISARSFNFSAPDSQESKEDI